MGIECPKCHFDNPDDTVYCGKCATPLPSSEEIPASPTKTLETPKEELTTGSTFAGRYQIIEELGKGGMGKVYKVHDTKIKEKIALKLIKPEIAKDKKTIERFSNELRLARKIRHKNICQMFDLGEEKGIQFITMEYVPGEDLRSSIRRFGQLPIGKSIAIANQICEGLAEAHRLGVVHRDLKSNNIMIDNEGNVRIMDFGIARSLESKGITGAGVMIGTPEYMSPEQVEAKEVDQRSDIYSLGIILYEMTTGRLPFEADTPFAVGVKQKSEEPENPKDINPQIPDDLSRVILRCLEKDKDARYQSAGEVRSELNLIEKGMPTTERKVPVSKPLTSKEITVQFSVKKIFIPVFIFVAIVIIGVIIWQVLLKKETISIPSDKPSVAVLPFVDLSPQEDQAYFCDGLADELINRLARIESLRVPARTSSFSFREKELDIQEIGRKLNVENVLEGSIRRAGNKLRITVQLVKVDDGYPLWSERYERNMEDIFTLQDEISLAIVDNLKIELLGKEKIEFGKSHTQNLEAYDLYLKGRFFWNRRTEESMKKSVECFQKAIEIDPSYALAYVGLADSYGTMTSWGILSPEDAWPEMKKAVTKAIEIDDLLAEAHVSLASNKGDYEWDWEGAEKEFKRALELNPNYPTAHQWYAEYLVRMGRFDEALKEINKAQEFDPLSLIISAYKGFIFLYIRDYDKALQQVQKTLNINPNFRPAILYRGLIYIEQGKYEEGIRDCEVVNNSVGLGIAFAKMGKIAEAQQLLENMINISSQAYVSPIDIAKLCFYLGDNDQGFTWLEKAYEVRAYGMTVLKVDPHYDTVRSDPRFKALLKKVNLE